ncbi:VanW family protein [Clostridium rectalis]|uniref:VanW family protein n=1 Tax=Clostridium rectalis TaxID=2040295 RepID=UPI000F63C5C0|nr:VanW family protein [Clostridium rectalis]
MVEKTSKKFNKRKIIIGVIITGAILLGVTVAGMSYMHRSVKKYSNLFYPGTRIENVDLSGKSLKEAKKLLMDQYVDKLPNRKIVVNTDNKSFSLEFSKLNIKYNLDKALEEAFNYGKDLNIFSKYKIIVDPDDKCIGTGFSYDKEVVKRFIDDIAKQVNKEPVNASINNESGKINLIKHKYGKKLDKDKLQKDIQNSMNGDASKDVEVQAHIEEVTPKVTSDKISSINSLISTFYTDYGSISSSQRANNIEICTKSINGTVLMPGEIFSFNKIVGERTEERGYQSASVIVGNQVDSGLGGGICQVSSTLYNTILLGNIKPTERTHHTLPSSYVPLGRDATVDWGNIDYKFKNTLPYPIYIEGIANGSTLIFNLYSNSELNKKTYTIWNEVYETINANMKTENDSSLPEGKEEIIQNAYTGYKVRVYKNTLENGKIINQELISDDFYRPVEGLAKVGAKKPDPKPEDTKNKKPDKDDNKKDDTNKDEKNKEKPTQQTPKDKVKK